MTENTGREYPQRPLIGVGAIIVGDRGVVLIKRGKPPRLGSWSLPGGAQKVGETVNEAARREIREETGLDAEVKGLVDVVDSISAAEDDGRIRYHYTLIDVPGHRHFIKNMIRGPRHRALADKGSTTADNL